MVNELASEVKERFSVFFVYTSKEITELTKKMQVPYHLKRE